MAYPRCLQPQHHTGVAARSLQHALSPRERLGLRRLDLGFYSAASRWRRNGGCPEWLAEWHYQQMLKNPDVVHAFYSGDNDYLIKTLLGRSGVESPATATLPGVAACGGASVSYWEYARWMSNIRARMQGIPSTGGITASYIIHPLGLGTLHTFATEFYYSTTYTQDAALNPQIKLMTWLKNIIDSCVYDAAKINFPSSSCQARNSDPLHVGY
jgi:hypothetical protein